MNRLSDFILIFKETYNKVNDEKTDAKKLIADVDRIIYIIKGDYDAFNKIAELADKIIVYQPGYDSTISEFLHKLRSIYLYGKKCIRKKDPLYYEYPDPSFDDTPDYGLDITHMYGGLEFQYKNLLKSGYEISERMKTAYKKSQYDKVKYLYDEFKTKVGNMKSNFGIKYVDSFDK